jgi:hypothetical protein
VKKQTHTTDTRHYDTGLYDASGIQSIIFAETVYESD